MQIIKQYTSMLLLVLSILVASACQNNSTDTSEDKATGQLNLEELVTYTTEEQTATWEDEEATHLTFDGDVITTDNKDTLVIGDQTVTIKVSGTYVLEGHLEDGQVVIDSEDNGIVRLVLNGVELYASDNAPIYVAQAEQTILTIAEGTENTVVDGEEYVLDTDEDEPNAAIFSKDNLTINGTGTLTVDGNYNNAISSKDDLKIVEGHFIIEAADDGLMGRDLLAIKSGTFTINAEGDGLKSTNDENEDKGNIILESGDFSITTGSDGFQSIQSIYIADGTFSIHTGGGSPEVVETANENRGGQWGDAMNPESIEADEEEEEDELSTKGLKAESQLKISGGTFTFDTLDDSLHSNKAIEISGGNFMIETGDDGVHADQQLIVQNGTFTILKSYEAMESTAITINGGMIDIVATDDGFNAASTIETDEIAENTLTINGGMVAIDAGGDGLDANGSITMTGGTVLIEGPTNNANGALDYDETFNISGGTLVASGSLGMVQAVSDQSDQSAVVMLYSEVQAADTLVHLEDGEGNTIINYQPSKNYQSILISTPDLTMNTTYSLYTDGSLSEAWSQDKLTVNDYQAGTEIISFTPENNVQWVDESGNTVANSGGTMPGGAKNGNGAGERPEGDFENRPDIGELPERNDQNPPNMEGDLGEAPSD